ncbi:hypothetical protein LOC08_10150, partial [Lactobacillus delbrueckii subsp. lactis]|nr:hypothetical protein [Lactobacillus delbrueckii subsp. lactis]MCD5520747.1 hypothetical protein [Lactobacillus delbrueckii subsp. lactis]MCD5524584.1 hypothetical protein [Lactobacillus delbrueckii subsp. lactis]MCD5526478.1 hypothetical protein [Lactobacillus delbrueckii subsp. lactis]
MHVFNSTLEASLSLLKLMVIASPLLSSKNDQNVIGTTKKIDKRTIAAKRRIMARSKGTDVVIQLL